jgi:hypothetical protein
MGKYAVALWTGEWVGDRSAAGRRPKWQLISIYDTKKEALIGIRRTREVIELTDETVISGTNEEVRDERD